ncbi:MAG: hypothetical protein E6Q78_05300 [Rhodoferax sp.]|nr:MAG: hypothetical protein E6Q78_05300 [Rhodoferax sp.]
MRYETNCMTGEVTEHPDADPTPVAPPTLKEQIAILEASVTPRRLREAAIGIDNGWLASVDGQITALRGQIQ